MVLVERSTTALEISVTTTQNWAINYKDYSVDVRYGSNEIDHTRFRLHIYIFLVTFCICENKDADQLRSNCAAYQRLCFRYTGTTIPLLSKIQNFKPLAIFCGCTARFVSDLIGEPPRLFFSQRGLFLPLSRIKFQVAWFFMCVFV